MANRREKGLCFNCDEKFTRGHRCSSKFFLLIADEEAAENVNNPTQEPLPHSENISDQPQAQISFYALPGHLAPKTLRLVGRIANHTVIILIDNYVQEHLVRTLDLSTQPTHPLRVVVGNGNEVVCHHLCAVTTFHV